MVFGLGKPNVEKMEKKKDIEGLINALGYEKDIDIRLKAADALGRIGELARDPLITALKNEDIYDGYIGFALEDIDGALAVEPLMKLLEDSDRGVRFAAFIGLNKIINEGKLGDKAPRVIDAIERYQENELPE